MWQRFFGERAWDRYTKQMQICNKKGNNFYNFYNVKFVFCNILKLQTFLRKQEGRGVCGLAGDKN